ncbi:MAG: cupin domain-containing protein [Pyrinomonadaceae bacterium]|nr:cupin domain-containing protein [Pyrinomonadaceae bacterium]
MISKRDLIVSTVTAVLTLGVVGLAQTRKPLMRSSVFEWSGIEVKQTKTGARRDFFDSPTATLDRFESHVTTINAGETPHPPHQHPEEELIVVKEGTIEAMQNGVTRRVGPGSMIFEASNELHGLRNVGQTPATYYVIKWFSPGAAKTSVAAKE